jgi:hypothetical protein
MELMAANDASLGSRLLDMALEDGAPRSSLAGLFPANLALSSLEDALMPLAATLPHLHPSSGRSVKIARKQAKRAQAKHPDMSIDKCTAIVLYTMEEFPRETSLYYALNLALRNQMRHVVRPWRDYVWLLLHALRELPPSTEVIVFRGCKTTPADLGLELTKGFEFTWSAFTSTATTQGVMQTFVGQDDGPRTLMTLKMTEQVGRDVRDFSVSPGENEILYPPNLCFEIVDSFDAGHGLIMVQCQQTETIDGILDLASSASEAEEVGWLQQMFGAPSQRGVEAAAEKAAAEKAAAEKAVAEKAAAEKAAAEKAAAEKAAAEKAAAEKAAAEKAAAAKEEGRRIERYANGDVYEGEWKAGKKEGRGIYRWADGAVYEGEYKADEKEGRGIFRWANGNVYEGELKAGNREGQGTFLYADGNIEVGFYKAGTRVGEGVQWTADGRSAWQLQDGEVVKTISLEEAERRVERLGLPMPVRREGKWAAGQRV